MWIISKAIVFKKTENSEAEGKKNKVKEFTWKCFESYKLQYGS